MSACGHESSTASRGKSGHGSAPEEQRPDVSAIDLTAAQLPSSDQYESGSQSSGKDTVDAPMPSVWLTKMKEESVEEGPSSLHTPKDLVIVPNPPYPQCSSAPTLTTHNSSSSTQSPKSNMAAGVFSPRKDKRRLGALVSLTGQPFSRIPDVDFSPKRLPDLTSSAGCPPKNWKITHSDRLNALIDECERIVDGRKVFKCKFCGKMYDIKSSMRYHMKIIHLQLHLRTSEMQCRICGKQFTCISAVNRHQLKCSANSTSTFTSTHPIQSSCGSTFLGKPRQPSLPSFASQSSSAFMNLNSSPGLRWSSGSTSGRHCSQPVSSQIPFTFSPATDTPAYLSPSVTSTFPSQAPRTAFDLDGPRVPVVPDLSPHQLGGSPLAHSVQNLVEGIPPFSFNEVFLASLGRTNGVGPNDRKPPMLDDLQPPGFMGAAHNFLAPPPSKRLRKSDIPSFVDGRLNENLYERLFSAQGEAAAGSATTATGTAIDLSLNASC
ncbi:unnamed protein product [Mesocestoides corti]|uniref:C2H2-type domain-containing protein n=1 Tax=Mesocestoides corti TaxID=53468 RepID=A0A0R3U1T6_MESCO|nr:unnamed protein product [Mesocestoides corti]